MATLAGRPISAHHSSPGALSPVSTSIIELSAVQHALWRLKMPVLDSTYVASYKRRAKLGMLWNGVRWHFLAISALVALESIGHRWGAFLGVTCSAITLATLFTWLSHHDLRWRTMPYRAFKSMTPVPEHVAAAADALISHGVAPEMIGVEYLKHDPVLFIEDDDRRYDLIVW